MLRGRKGNNGHWRNTIGFGLNAPPELSNSDREIGIPRSSGSPIFEVLRRYLVQRSGFSRDDGTSLPRPGVLNTTVTRRAHRDARAFGFAPAPILDPASLAR
jgi:hypothetical protein